MNNDVTNLHTLTNDMTKLIYGLYSSRDKIIRYVGKTTALTSRLEQHRKGDTAGGPEKVKWVEDEQAAGYKIESVVLIANASSFDEQRMIDVYNAARAGNHKQLFNQPWALHVQPTQTKPGVYHGTYLSERDAVTDIARQKNITVREATRQRSVEKNQSTRDQT